MTNPHLAAESSPAGDPPGWHLECPDCGWLHGQHREHCRGVSIPVQAGVPAPAAGTFPAAAATGDPQGGRTAFVTQGVPQVTPAPGSRLEQLLAMRDEAEAAADEAAARFTAIKAGIIAEMAAAYPGRAIVDVAAGPNWHAQRLRYHEGTLYVPVGPLREKHKDVWDELAVRKRGSWQLHPLGDDT
jgi:hypothetical protein